MSRRRERRQQIEWRKGEREDVERGEKKYSFMFNSIFVMHIMFQVIKLWLYFFHSLIQPDTCPYGGERRDQCECVRENGRNSGYTAFSKIRLNTTTLIVNSEFLFYLKSQENFVICNFCLVGHNIIRILINMSLVFPQHMTLLMHMWCRANQ